MQVYRYLIYSSQLQKEQENPLKANSDGEYIIRLDSDINTK